MSDWESTAHPQIQIRMIAPHVGFEVRIGHHKRAPDRCVACPKCGKVVAKLKSGEPWKHKCKLDGEVGWKVLMSKAGVPKAYGTRQLAYAAGARALNLVDGYGHVIGAAA